jgi:hypothetical protein
VGEVVTREAAMDIALAATLVKDASALLAEDVAVALVDSGPNECRIAL